MIRKKSWAQVDIIRITSGSKRQNILCGNIYFDNYHYEELIREVLDIILKR